MTKQLTEEERYQIYGLLKAGYKKKEIAKALGRDTSTLYREINRNSGQRGYRPKQAQELSDKRRREARKAIHFTKEVELEVRKGLSKRWSPEQISRRLKAQRGIRISHERIYQYIAEDKRNGGDLYKQLRHSAKQRKKRYGGADRRGQIKGRVSIAKRPKAVDKRSRIGDWELDTMIGKHHKGALVTIVDRLSLKTLIKKVPSKHAEIVSAACIARLKPYAKYSHTATADNGKEFAFHDKIAKQLNIAIYFADPYSSWQRGSNENTNGLIRQYIPKKSDLNAYSDKAIADIEDALNNRPRKCLGYKTPNEFFDEMRC